MSSVCARCTCVLLLLILIETLCLNQLIVAPNGQDDYPEIQSAINKAIKAGGGNIVLKSGEYNLSKTLTISNAVNVSLIGAGIDKTFLIIQNRVSAIYYHNCDRLTISSLSIDYARLPNTAGYITALATSSPFYMDIKVAPSNDMDVGYVGETIYAYDPVNKRPAFGAETYEIYQPDAEKSIKVAEGIVRVPLKQKYQFKLNQAIIVRSGGTCNHVIAGGHSKNLCLENLMIYSGDCMGHAAHKDTNVIISNYHVKKRYERWLSTNADCIHLTDHRGFIKIVDSSCEGMGDDGLNIHSFFFKVSKVVNNNTAEISLYKNWPDTLDVGTGTTLSFSRAATPFNTYLMGKIISGKKITDDTWSYTFDKVITSIAAGDFAYVGSPDAASVFISNFTVGNNRARAAVLETINAVVERSLFRQTSGPAILFQPSLRWGESPAGYNITLIENVFYRNNEGIAQQQAAITSLPEPVQLIPSIFKLNFIRNTFNQSVLGKSAFQAFNAGDVLMKDNYIEQHNSNAPMTVCNSQRIKIEHNNLVIVDSSYPNPITYYDKNQPCELSRSGEINLTIDAYNATFKAPVLPSPTGYGVIVNK